jgi:hypothetical protein
MVVRNRVGVNAVLLSKNIQGLSIAEHVNYDFVHIVIN